MAAIATDGVARVTAAIKASNSIVAILFTSSIYVRTFIIICINKMECSCGSIDYYILPLQQLLPDHPD